MGIGVKRILSCILNCFGQSLRRRRFLDADDVVRLMFGKNMSWQLKNRQFTCIRDAEFKVYSQWGDDGIIQYLIQNIPIKHRRFVEFGVADYRESNTRFLLQNNNWSGLVWTALKLI